ncbi:NAD-dependent epimerase/dehydratase family protein [Paenibacillus nanensis]|uniref:NAD-dependent epimerase/dehydratase family protein n=1 Tax=Paenibacillus nanensis TaxID=393251 RepID=A0A3A1UUW6_9BACL|nr:polysaccharide biosynthesis protein [Paenibacillus nanensis]RIX52339.1 NAD-dependent epimerase/dehydratase family protein [Paenibacillus nanensis]
MFEGATILITGGTGSWGQELTRKLLSFEPKEIRVFSRNEFAQVQMQRSFEHPALRFMIGDVRDQEAVSEACRNADYVFHLAALKHVPICELQPDEALKTNVIGTENVINASIRHGVKKVIDVSTDKAVDPINFYGMTKAFAEKLMIRANALSDTTRFVCVRGGNVLGTQGSVVPYFKNLLLQKKDLPLTSPKMTRFFLTLSQAIDLLLKAAIESVGGETYVMKMKACRIDQLAEVLIDHFSDGTSALKIIGLRPGEKLHEVLVSPYEAERTYKFGGQYYVILPEGASQPLHDKYSALEKAGFTQYHSDLTLLSKEEIKAMLQEGGFLD